MPQQSCERADPLDGRLDDAIAHYRHAVRSNPKHALAHYNLAVALLRRDTRRGYFLLTTAWLFIQISSRPTLLREQRRGVDRLELNSDAFREAILHRRSEGTQSHFPDAGSVSAPDAENSLGRRNLRLPTPVEPPDRHCHVGPGANVTMTGRILGSEAKAAPCRSGTDHGSIRRRAPVCVLLAVELRSCRERRLRQNSRHVDWEALPTPRPNAFGRSLRTTIHE